MGVIMTLIKIDRDMLVDELYQLRALIPLVEGDDAKQKLMEIVQLVQQAPVSETAAAYPRPRMRRG
jgi:hypothetical protein